MVPELPVVDLQARGWNLVKEREAGRELWSKESRVRLLVGIEISKELTGNVLRRLAALPLWEEVFSGNDWECGRSSRAED